MYYLWKVRLILNSGTEVCGYYETTQNESQSVAKELINGTTNTFNAMINKEKTEQILFKVGDVSVIALSAG